jgi:plastocyanin
LSVQNDDSTDHTFTIPEVDLNEGIDPGEDVGVDVSALTEGAYPFRCTIHPQMTGVLTV